MIADKDHLKNAFEYILFEQGAEAWTWSFRDPNWDGVMGRKRRDATSDVGSQKR
jgi:hypothetical protein